MGEVIVIGSINTDLVTYVERLPGAGETVTGGVFKSFPGGKGANQAVAAAKAGANVSMFGAVGDDSYGRERVESLWENMVSTDGIIVKKGSHSGIAQIIVDRNGENLIAVASGANHELKPEDVSGLIERNTGGDATGRGETGAGETGVDGEKAVALFQNEIRQEVTERLIVQAKSEGYIVVWNTAPAPSGRVREEVLSSTDFVICNETELSALVALGNHHPPVEAEDEEEKIRELAGMILSKGVGNVIVTLGSRGSLLINDREIIRQESYTVDAIDTVGAGDCFCGVFAASLAEGLALSECMDRATRAASISVTREGAQTSMPTREEIDSFGR